MNELNTRHSSSNMILIIFGIKFFWLLILCSVVLINLESEQNLSTQNAGPVL